MKVVTVVGLIVAGAGAVALDRQFDLVGKARGFVPGLTQGAQALTRAPDAAAVKPAPRKVRVVSPKAGGDRFGLTLPGRTAPIEQARLSARAAGVVSDRRGEIGDQVKAGDVLVVIDAPEVRQQLDRANAAVAQTKARLALAELSLDRADELVPKRILTEQTRDERRANMQTAKADLDAANAEVRRLQEIEKFQTIRAPFDGTIISRQVERGDRVSGDSGGAAAFFYNIARLDQLRIEIDVPQSMALKVKAGTPARMTFAEIPGRLFDAKVIRTTQLIETASSTMRAELVMSNPDLELPAGLNGQVVLDVERESACVLVPGNALVVQQGGQFVAIVDEADKISFRAVRLGRDLGTEVEICSGLATSDRVILSPNALLKPGDTVEIIQPVG
jgi:membrane fusion protein, multidrug efflux system